MVLQHFPYIYLNWVFMSCSCFKGRHTHLDYTYRNIFGFFLWFYGFCFAECMSCIHIQILNPYSQSAHIISRVLWVFYMKHFPWCIVVTCWKGRPLAYDTTRDLPVSAAVWAGSPSSKQWYTLSSDSLSLWTTPFRKDFSSLALQKI